MTLAPQKPDGRVCVADCGKLAPECHCKTRMIIGVDLSNGVGTGVEGFWKDGRLLITDVYDIVDVKPNSKEPKS